MPIVVPPRGTRGNDWKMPRPLMAAMVGVFHLAYRVFGGRMRVQGRPLIELETVGARSGLKRLTVLGVFPGSTDGPEAEAPEPRSWVVVASNGGSPRNPAWLLNLARHPDQVWVSVARQRIRVRPDLLEGAERERAWQEITSLAKGYAGYQERTDRVIPIVRLSAEGQSADPRE